MGPYTSPQRPPVSPGGQISDGGHTSQIRLPPHAQLQELQEELDDEGPDGAENFLTMINEEMEEVDYHYPPRNTNPIIEQKNQELVTPTPKKEKSSGLGFGIKQGMRLSSKKAGQNKKDKPLLYGEGKDVPAILKAPKEPDPEFKGFDGFFLY